MEHNVFLDLAVHGATDTNLFLVPTELNSYVEARWYEGSAIHDFFYKNRQSSA